MAQVLKTLRWFAPLYFYQAMPFFLVTSVSTVFYKQYGISNTVAALLSSIFYAPWVIKPLGGPFVQAASTLKRWVIGTQVLTASLLGLAAFSTHSSFAVVLISICFGCMAILGTLQDIAAEGYYLIALDEKEQTRLIAWRATFFRLGWLSMQGGAIYLAGLYFSQSQDAAGSWQKVLLIYLVGFVLLTFLLSQVLPRIPKRSSGVAGFWAITVDFFKRKDIIEILLFILLYRFSEAQLQKLAIPFFMDPRDIGGLGIPTTTIGMIYGTLGPIFLTIGGFAGGAAVTKWGLKKCIVTMAISVNLSHALYVWMAYQQPMEISWIAFLINFEQFFYGFSFTGFLLFMVRSSQGKYPTAHYAICTGLMAMGMMIPGSWSGWLQDRMGYPSFFVWVLFAGIPCVWVSVRARRAIS